MTPRVAQSLGELVHEILIPEARAAHEAGNVELRDSWLDQTDRVLERMIDSMPDDPPRQLADRKFQ